MGFPNVRLAEHASETAALAARLTQAEHLATSQQTHKEIAEFRNAAGASAAVICRNIDGVFELFTKDGLSASFHEQVRMAIRIPQDNQWDRGRTSAEGAVHPLYYGQIQYAALSLDGRGAEGWGGFSMLLDDRYFGDRATVFEENIFAFLKRHKVIAGQRVPFGYRATWQRRGELALAKLHSKVKPGCTTAEFSGILLDQKSGRSDADFIEVHIYGPIRGKTVRQITAKIPQAHEDKLIWQGLKKKIAPSGIPIVELP